MAATLISKNRDYIGTNAERVALDVTGFPAGVRFFETDTASVYILDGDETWAAYPTFLPSSGGTVTGMVTVSDDVLFRLGTSGDQVFLNRSTVLNADTALANVLVAAAAVEGQALAANSLIISNVTSNGDIAVYVNKAGNSQQVFWADGSSGDTAVMAATGASIDAYIAGTKVLDYATGAFQFQQNVTISSTGTLTIGAVTLGGTVTGANQSLTGLGNITMSGTYIARTVDNSYLEFRSGVVAAGSGAHIILYGKDLGAGQLLLDTPNATLDADVTRLTISGAAATAVATWANVTHTGIVLSGALNANSQNITAVAGITVNANAVIQQVSATNAGMKLAGGTDTAGFGGNIWVFGKTHATYPGQIYMETPDAAGTANVTRFQISGVLATAVATWTNVTHTGISVTSGGSITGAGAWSLATVTGALTLAPADANIQMTVPTTKSVNIGVSANFKRFYSEITLATDNAETDVGLTPAAVILSAAIRVSVEITGLDEADHHIQLGINGNASKYIDVAQGAAATTISVNKKGKYTFDPTTDTEAAALKLTITGGADQIPTAGKAYVEVIYLDSSNLADV